MSKLDSLTNLFQVPYRPYFYVQTRTGLQYEVSRFISRRFERMSAAMKVDLITKEDLDLLNHLSGLKGSFIKLSFDHVDEMRTILRPIREAVSRNKKLAKQNQSDLARVSTFTCFSFLTSEKSKELFRLKIFKI